MKTNKWLLAGVSSAMAVTLVGCGSTASNGNGSSNSNSSSPQTLKIAFPAEPEGLDPSNSQASSTFTFLNMTNEGLYRVGPDGKPQLGVAAAMPQISADGKTYTIKLNPNAKWSDGSQVTAQDFVYSWMRTCAPDSQSQYEFLFEKWIQGAADYHSGKDKTGANFGIKALDSTTLQIKLINPVSFFTTQLAFPLFFPEKQSFVEKAGGTGKFGGDANTVLFNGPFKLVKWDHNQDLEFEKNPNYWDAKDVKLNNVQVNIVQDPTTFENLYQSGQEDVGTINSDILPRWQGKPDYQQEFDSSSWYLQFNEKNPALKNAKIRQALTLAVDRNQFVNVLQPGSVAATGLVPVKISDGNNNEFRKTAGNTEPAYNPTQAKQLLQQGLQELGMKSLPKITLMGDDTDTAKKMMTFLQGQWQQNLGVSIDVQSVPNKLRIQNMSQRNYDIVFAGWGADYNDPMTFFDMWVTGGSFNEVGYSNPQYDALIKAAQTEADASKRAQDFVQAEKILMNDMPIGPVYYRAQMWLVRPSLKGFYFDQNGPEFELKYASLS